MLLKSNIRNPDFISLETEYNTVLIPCAGKPSVTERDITVTCTLTDEGLDVAVRADKTPLKWIALRWNMPMPEGASYMADAFERSYGDLEWRHMAGNRFMPWYFLASLQNETRGYGVKVRAGSMCFWQADERGVSLWMDVRNGGSGVILGGRTLSCATVVSHDYRNCTAFDAAQQFCACMCTDPLLPKAPVYGSNNWYYAYGYSSQEDIIRDADMLAELTEGLENRPYMVVDSCWQSQCTRQDSCAGGPWEHGNQRFPDMEALAREIKSRDEKPGIWMRLLKDTRDTIPEGWRNPRNPELLDPSVPEVLEHVQQDVRRVVSWGYELMKFDFSTWDILNRWGPEMNPSCTDDGWRLHDRSRTNAEIIVSFYQAIRDAGGPDLIVIGCNCVGHLIAGIAQLNRIGDDTSGRDWERTRVMGVNTLAFRLPQNRNFYMADADCLGILGPIPWELNRQWGHLLANSGTPFFVSIKPGILNATQKEEMKAFFSAASRQTGTAVPLDWMSNTCPSRWLINQEEVTYSWYPETGAARQMF